MKGRRPLWTLGAILALAAVLRGLRLDGSSLWSDEGNSWAMLSRGYAAIAAAAAQDIHPPGYYWLLKAWCLGAGDDAWGMRSLSALCGLALVWVVYRIGYRWGSRIAVTAALLAAVNPFLVYYSQEARMYSLLALEGGLLFWAALQLVDRDPTVQWPLGGRPALLFGLSAAAGLWTHYSFPVVLAAANLFLLIVLWRRSSRAGRRPVVIAALLRLNLPAVLIFSPWLPTAWRAVTHWPAGGGRLPATEALKLVGRTFAFGPFGPSPLALLDSSLGLVAGPGLWTVRMVLALALLLPLLGLWSLRRSAGGGAPVLWLGAPLGLMFGLGLFGDAFQKFLLVAAPAWCLAFASGVAALAGARTRSALLGVGLLALGGLLPAAAALAGYYRAPGPRDDYAGVARELAAQGDPRRDLVLLCAPGQAEVWDYYDPGLPVLALPAQRPPDALRTVAALSEAARGRRQLTALWWAAADADPAGIIAGWLAEHAFPGPTRWAGNVQVAYYGLAPELDCAAPPGPADFADGIRLEAACFPRGEDPAPGRLLLTALHWRALARPSAAYAVSVQLLRPAEDPGRSRVAAEGASVALIAQHDGRPASGTRPSDAWAAGEIVEDRHAVAVPTEAPPGSYLLRIALYDPADGRRLAAGARDHVDLPMAIRASAGP